MSAASSIPLVVIEGVLVLGGALLFGWWQLRSVRRDQRLWAERRRQEEQARSAPPGPHDTTGGETSGTPAGDGKTGHPAGPASTERT